MSKIIPFSITKGSPGVTLSAGTANNETKVVEFQVQPGMNLILEENSTLELKDDGATESADSSYVKVQIVAPDNNKTVVLQRTTYGQTKFNPDINLKNKLNYPLRVGPFNLVQVFITSSQSLATATTRFMLNAKAEVN